MDNIIKYIYVAQLSKDYIDKGKGQLIQWYAKYLDSIDMRSINYTIESFGSRFDATDEKNLVNRLLHYLLNKYEVQQQAKKRWVLIGGKPEEWT